MARLKNSIIGQANGSVGNVVVTQWKGIGVMREKPQQVHNPKTPAQLAHRAKFSLMVAFLAEATDFVNIGFKHLADKKSAFNVAMQENIGNAVAGDYPDLSIDMEEVTLSRGKLRKLLNPTISSTVANTLELNWTDNTGNGNALDTDKLMVFAYDTDSLDGYCEVKVANRSETGYQMALPFEFSGKEIHVIVGLVKADGAKVSNSQYLGRVTIV
ncbi:hypothetical protein EP331_11170 [bacterium]|nr:MAG: hypothetical protein EP331_11170 [bacterium]